MKKWAILLLVGFLIIWSFYIEPRNITINHIQVTPSGWPQHIGPVKVAFIADLHAGSTVVGLDEVSEVVQLVNQHQPDLVLLGGDYVATASLGGEDIPPRKIAFELSKLKAPLGVVAVLGNHDWWLNGDLVRSELEKVGVVVLENQIHQLAREDGDLWIAGMADDMTRTPDVAGALLQIPDGAATIILSHDPAQFLDVPKGPYFTVAGHTHGGQVFLPLVGALITPSRAPREWAYGLVRDDERDMYVTSGVGTSILPVRFNMPPEVVVIDIAGKE